MGGTVGGDVGLVHEVDLSPWHTSVEALAIPKVEISARRLCTTSGGLAAPLSPG
jgi:hypothetical protein